MGKVLYEVSYQFDIFLLIPVVLLIASFVIPPIAVRSHKKHGPAINIPWLKKFVLAYRIFASVILCIIIISEITTYSQVIAAYKNGAYQTVEGYVENFDPMPYGGHSQESFAVNGVEFSYSDYAVTQGYHNAASHGGVITHDGQHLKLRYITRGTENVIVYIEELP